MKISSALSVIVSACCSSAVVAQGYGYTPMAPLPNNNNFQDACRAAQGRYRTYVEFFKAANSQTEKSQWIDQINETKEEIDKYCNR